MRTPPSLPSLSIALLSCLAPSASAQQYVDERIAYGSDSGTSSTIDLIHGDIDGDSWIDILVRQGSSTSTVLRGGPAGFAYATTVGDSSDSILVDLNGDGLLDLLTQNFVNLGYYVGQPDATFGAFVTIQAKGANESFWTKRTADVNGDGALDVVCSVSTNLTGSAGVLRWFAGNSLGSFGSPQSTASMPYPLRFELGDVNGDGFVDAVATGPQGQTAMLFQGTGAGFAPPQPLAASNAAAQLVAVADFDADGIHDIACYPAAASFSWFRGGFSGPTYVATHALPGATSAVRDLVTTDLDANGTADLLLVESVFANGRVWRSDGSTGTGLGTPTVAVDVPCFAVDAFEYDGNPGLDLVYDGITTKWPSLRPGDGAGGFAEPIVLHAPGTCVDPDSVSAGDLDRDGALDLGFESGAWLRGIGDGSFQPAAPLGARPSQLVDLNGDGLLDAVGLLRTCGGSNGLVVSLHTPTGFGAATKPSQSAFTLEDFAIADLDADGDLDLATAGSGGAFTHRNDGTGAFAPFTTTPLPSSCTRIGAGDLNADGLADLVAAHIIEDAFQIYSTTLEWGLSTGNGQLTAVQSKTLPNVHVSQIVIEDVDGDSTADVLFAQDTIFVLHGDGAGNLTDPVNLASQPGANNTALAIAIADVDGDGQRDVIGGATPGNHVGIVRWTPTAYALWREIPAGTGAGKLLPYDFDADGQIDLAWGYGDTAGLALNQKSDPLGVTPFGTGTFGCRGRASIGTVEPATVGNGAFRIRTQHMPPHAQGWFLFSSGSSPAGFDPFGVGVTLHIDPLPPSIFVLVPSLANASGEANLAVPIPSSPGLIGANFTVQAAHSGALATGENCSSSPIAIVSSRGLALTIHP